jgi:hypothetical protein
MPNTKIWSSNYPTELDTTASMPSVQYADYVDISHVNELKKAVLELETLVGSDDLETGSLRYLIDNVSSSLNHNDTHLSFGDDYIEGNDLYIDFEASNYEPTCSSSDKHRIYPHLRGIDNAIGSLSPGLPGLIPSHSYTHLSGGNDYIEGDYLYIDWEASNYENDEYVLGSHLQGIDDAIGSLSSSINSLPSSSGPPPIPNNKFNIINGDLTFIANNLQEDGPQFLTQLNTSITTSAGEYVHINLSGVGRAVFSSGSYMVYGFFINNTSSYDDAKKIFATSYSHSSGSNWVFDDVPLNFTYILGPCPSGTVNIYPFAAKNPNNTILGDSGWNLEFPIITITQLGFNGSNTNLVYYPYLPI